nr:retrotransposon-related protein [Tanacetum cinerariifolium]
MGIFLNSLIRHKISLSLQLYGTIGTSDVHVLIDYGSTYNFVQPSVVEQMQLPITTTKPFEASIDSGETLLCENICSHITIRIQGLAMEVDLYVLPINGHDIVLGIQWLQKLGKVSHDYAHQTMEFSLVIKKYTLQGDESLHMKQISLHYMQALLDMEEVYGVYELHILSTKDRVHETPQVASDFGHPEVDELLARSILSF